MKNWIVTILVLVLPVVAYYVLKNNQEAQVSFTAQAANKPTVIKFSSPMCSDCQKIKIEFDALKPQYQDKIDFVEINATSNDRQTQEQIEKYGVTLAPTVIFINPTQHKMQKIEGYQTRAKIEQYLKEMINE